MAEHLGVSPEKTFSEGESSQDLATLKAGYWMPLAGSHLSNEWF